MQTGLTFDSQLKAVVATISGHTLDSDEFRAFALKQLMLLKEKKANKLIVDIGKLGIMCVADQRWLKTEWNQKAINNGLRYLAFVVPKDIFGKVAMQNSTADEHFNQVVAVSYFDDIKKAEKWLIEQG